MNPILAALDRGFEELRERIAPTSYGESNTFDPAPDRPPGDSGPGNPDQDPAGYDERSRLTLDQVPSTISFLETGLGIRITVTLAPPPGVWETVPFGGFISLIGQMIGIQINGLVRQSNGVIYSFGPTGNGINFLVPFTNAAGTAYQQSTEELTIGPVDAAIESLSVQVGNEGSFSIPNGICYVKVERLVRLSDGSAHAVGVLVAGYVTAQHAITFPGTAVQMPTQGRGYMRAINVPVSPTTLPAISPPPHAIWRVHAFSLVLTTSAFAGVRTPLLRMLNAVGINDDYPSQTGIVANPSTGPIVYHWGEGVIPVTQLIINHALIPRDLYLVGRNTDTLKGFIVNHDGGDSITQVYVLVEEWIDP